MEKDLKKKISDLPKSPGVYQFFDKTGDILYVGKAKNLKNRVKSYFAKEIGRGPIIDAMMDLADDLKFIETDSEIEALLLESDLINKIKPKYNSRQKDDKSFLLIKISKKQHSASSSQNSDFPCVELVRYRNVDFKDKSADYFGPYPAGELLKKSLRYLRKVFPYRDCSKSKFNTYSKKGRPCLYGDIRICTAPCVCKVSKEDYAKNILYLKNFFRGKKGEIVKSINKDIKKLVREQNFEEAAVLRDRLRGLEHMKDVAIGLRDDSFNGAGILFKRIECYDISNIGKEYAVGSMVVFTEGKADKSEYRHFKIRALSSESQAGYSDLERLQQVLERRFGNDWLLPDLLLIDGGPLQLKVGMEAVRKFNLKIPVASIAKGPKRDKNEFHYSDELIAKYINNYQNVVNILISARDEAHRFAISYYRKLHKKDMLEK